MKKPNVYVVSRSCHDFSMAEKFGHLIFLSSGPINLTSTSKMYRKFYQILKNSEPTDYILPSGLSIMGMIACSIFSVLHGRLNLLIYQYSTRLKQAHYEERIIMIKGE